jgi:hypothetical protein
LARLACWLAQTNAPTDICLFNHDGSVLVVGNDGVSRWDNDVLRRISIFRISDAEQRE